MDARTTEENTSLIPIPAGPLEVAKMFADAKRVDDLIDRIEATARSFHGDVGTAKGRAEIRKIAADVARAKVALDGAGKDLNAEKRKQIEAVDAERRKIRDRLDALKDEVRKPLTDWEEAEAARKAEIEAKIQRISEPQANALMAPQAIAQMIEALAEIVVDDSFDDRQDEAALLKDTTMRALRDALTAAEKREADEAELARLRKAEEERAAKEAEERAQREAEEAKARADEEARKAEEDFAWRFGRYLDNLAMGILKGEQKPHGIIIHELEGTALEQMANAAPRYREDLESKRLHALETIREDQKRAEEKARADKEERDRRAKEQAEERARAAAEQARKDAEAEAKRKADAEAAEARRREENKRIRTNRRKAIAEALEAFPVFTPEVVAEAIVEGRLPNVRVEF